jgi:hypothetical protein
MAITQSASDKKSPMNGFSFSLYASSQVLIMLARLLKTIHLANAISSGRPVFGICKEFVFIDLGITGFS